MRKIEVEVPDETADQLQRWSKDTGKSIPELLEIALSLLNLAVDTKTELIKQDVTSGEQSRLVV